MAEGENPVTAAGETLSEIVAEAKDAVTELTKEAEETATGATEVPAEVVDRVAYATVEAVDALSERVKALEGGAFRAVEEAEQATGDTVQEVAAPDAVPNVAAHGGRHSPFRFLR